MALSLDACMDEEKTEPVVVEAEFKVPCADGIVLAGAVSGIYLATHSIPTEWKQHCRSERSVTCAIVCHGLLSSKEGGFIPSLAKKLCLSRCVDAVIRYDSRGNGASTGHARISGLMLAAMYPVSE